MILGIGTELRVEAFKNGRRFFVGVSDSRQEVPYFMKVWEIDAVLYERIESKPCRNPGLEG
jgi:hypothetical protein